MSDKTQQDGSIMPEDLTRPGHPVDHSNPADPARAHPVAEPVPQPAFGAEAALRLQVIRQQASLDSQAARLADQTGQIAALAARLRDSDTRIGTLIREGQALHREAADLRREVAALRASHSWRITAPLRGLRRASWWLARLWPGPARGPDSGTDSGTGGTVPRE